jgi:hypothetical protein
MSSATFDKLLVLLGPSLEFQDARIRKSVPPEERLAVTLRKKHFYLIFNTYFIHYCFIWNR